MEMEIVVAPDVSSAGGFRPADKGRLFESFVKDILLAHSHVESAEFRPKNADIWGYEIVGQTNIMVECKATSDPIRKEAVAAFYGDYNLARREDEHIVAVMMSTGGFTGETHDSAKGYYDDIKKKAPNDKFYIYDSAQMIQILLKQGKVKTPLQIVEVLERVPSLGEAIDWTFLITATGRFWLVRIESAEPSFLVLDPKGALVDGREVARLPWESLSKMKPEVNLDAVKNGAIRSPLLSPTSPPRQLGNGRITDRVSRSGRMYAQVEAIAGRALRLSCDEAGESLCKVTERLAASYFDHLMGPDDLSELDDEKAAKLLACLRIAAIYTAASIAHPQRRHGLRDVRSYVKTSVQAVSRHERWPDNLEEDVEAVLDSVTSLASPSVKPLSNSRFAILSALGIHFATAFGPFCGLYKRAIFDQTDSDDPMSLIPGVPRLREVWIDDQTQILRISLEAPTPRTHRYVTANQGLVHDVVERAEDRVDHVGSGLLFTRVGVSVAHLGFETIECFFELDNDHVLKIFMGEELYGTKDVWIREVMQNAIDATMLRKVLSSDSGYLPKIALSYDSHKKVVEIADNGIGMSLHQVRKFFSKIGRSYYRSIELEEELRRAQRSYSPISRFGVGFLSVFMIASSVEIVTASALEPDSESLSIYIPALMEDFYVRKISRDRASGTKITLHLREALGRSLRDLITTWVLKTDVSTSLIEDQVRIDLTVDGVLNVIPNVVPGGWDDAFHPIFVQMDSDDLSAAFCIPIPKRRSAEAWQRLPETRIAIAQAGIFVKDENELFGQKRGPHNSQHSYFRKVYGLINYRPGALKIGVSRNEFVVDKNSAESVRSDLLGRAIPAIARQIESEIREVGDAPDEVNRYLSAVLFNAIVDGQQGFYTPANISLTSYSYSNAKLLDDMAADIYARNYFCTVIDRTGSSVVRLHTAYGGKDSKMSAYYSLNKTIGQDPLFRAWIADEAAGAKVFVVGSPREAALLLRGLSRSGYRGVLTKVSRELLQRAIRFEVILSPLDRYLRAACGIVKYGDYKPSTAILVFSAQGRQVVSRPTGFTTFRSECPYDPYVLIDSTHWLTQFLIEVARVAEEIAGAAECLREICTLLLTIATDKSIKVQREATQAANKYLADLYDGLALSANSAGSLLIGKRQKILLEDLVGKK